MALNRKNERRNTQTLTPQFRPFLIRASTYKVCLLTGDAGTDGTHLYPRYPDLLGKRYVGPYIHLCPDFAFVVEDEEGVCGYILGALDSRLFYEQYTEWLLKLLSEHKLLEKNKEDFTAEDFRNILHCGFSTVSFVCAEFGL
ncbi:protein O-GlcNAcase-like [Corticium candelabrum]|uniref:protein O-GlcNAcase-like n=1 Tax=Corticium candelabrum TaxID=121492 RepID=UPI002E256C8F|nr:protein O-GlcNAcase-like [Corticium candelabrum]